MYLSTVSREEICAAWREAALQEWQRNVVDVDNSETILQYYDAIGWGGWVRNGYRNTRRYAWCGVFAAYCGLRLGRNLNSTSYLVSLDYDIARFVLPSTFRIASQAKWEAAGVPPGTLIYKDEELEKLKESIIPGTLLTVGTGPAGSHIVIVDTFDPETGEIKTIEGNAFGMLADGSYGEGVVRRTRQLKNVCLALVFHEQHFWIDHPFHTWMTRCSFM